MKIAVAGLGYVGSSMLALLSQKYSVYAVDIDHERLAKVGRGLSPVDDPKIAQFLTKYSANIHTMYDQTSAFGECDIVIVCTPTSYDPEANRFDLTSVDEVIAKAVSTNPSVNIVIKSTIPIGYCEDARARYDHERIYFSPEFLREGSSLQDNLYPSRIIVGDTCDFGKLFSEILVSCAHETNIPVLLTTSKEAECIKLFANSYLAMRVGFINELDSFALNYGLNAKSIIDGITLDPRIGPGYCNPSFGYGGYCFPKDTKQLMAQCKDLPTPIIDAIVETNNTRSDIIAQELAENYQNSTVGFYRFLMKAGSDNIRDSASGKLMEKLRQMGLKVVVYEPLLKSEDNPEVIESFDEFILKADVVVANRIDENLNGVKKPIFSRDIYRDN